MQEKWIEKIYAGFLGMDAGMRLGAPVENPYWTYERLEEYYGNMEGYLREYRHYAADDDVNGPVIFLRVLIDWGKDFTPKQAGETWLNYTRRGHGMFWWGGEDMSTEHRAYMNLKRGVSAPKSGSIALNGQVAAEQIGGQIFVDTWGLIYPGDPAMAARQARKAASVSHDGEGLYGAQFMAACVAAAFTCTTVDEVLDAGLAVLPRDCDYRRVVESVRAFHKKQPDDFRACRNYVDREWGAHKYPGYCHIIPNAGICVLALLYGKGELGRTIEIACMCGFDTDCNASNTGTITGVLGGLENFPARYRTSINDCVVLSSVSGFLNMLDSAAFSKELAVLAYRLRGEQPPAWLVLPRPGDMLMDFEMPGSTHGLELTDRASHWIRPVQGEAHTGKRCLEMMIDGKLPVPVDLFFRGSFMRSDFNDERYEPVFSPRVYPGQTVSCWMKSKQEAPAAITVTPFLTTAVTGQRKEMKSVVLPDRTWHQVSFQVPELAGDQVHFIGWKVEIDPMTPPWTLGRVFVDDITVTGPMAYAIDMSIQKKEFDEITPFSCNDIQPDLQYGELVLRTECGGQAFTGNYYTRDGAMEGEAVVESGDSCMLLLRGKGTRNFYALGLDGENAVIACCENGEWTQLAAVPYGWQRGETLRLRAEAEGSNLRLLVDGALVLQAADDRFAYGMVGVCHPGAASSRWKMFAVTGQI